MDEPVFDYALPDRGEIRLSQIKAEFGKGNNLTAYYGVVSGIPSSGVIKNTDFYGKQSGQAPVGMSGEYQGSFKRWQSTDPNNIGNPQFSYVNLAECQGTGAGYPVSWENQAGVYAIDRSSIEASTAKYVYVAGNSASASNNYPYLMLGPIGGSDYRKYSGSWTHRKLDNMWDLNTPSVQSKNVTQFGSTAAGEYLWELLNRNSRWYIGVSSTPNIKDMRVIYTSDQEGEG